MTFDKCVQQVREQLIQDESTQQGVIPYQSTLTPEELAKRAGAELVEKNVFKLQEIAPYLGATGILITPFIRVEGSIIPGTSIGVKSNADKIRGHFADLSTNFHLFQNVRSNGKGSKLNILVGDPIPAIPLRTSWILGYIQDHYPDKSSWDRDITQDFNFYNRDDSFLTTTGHIGMSNSFYDFPKTEIYTPSKKDASTPEGIVLQRLQGYDPLSGEHAEVAPLVEFSEWSTLKSADSDEQKVIWKALQQLTPQDNIELLEGPHASTQDNPARLRLKDMLRLKFVSKTESDN